jgi:hypothetical protein
LALDALNEQQHEGYMPKKKDPPLSTAEQRKRFEELAREVGSRTPSESEIKRGLKKFELKRVTNKK